MKLNRHEDGDTKCQRLLSYLEATRPLTSRARSFPDNRAGWAIQSLYLQHCVVPHLHEEPVSSLWVNKWQHVFVVDCCCALRMTVGNDRSMHRMASFWRSGRESICQSILCSLSTYAAGWGSKGSDRRSGVALRDSTGWTSTVLYLGSTGSVMCSMARISSLSSMTPSVRRNPVTSSSPLFDAVVSSERQWIVPRFESLEALQRHEVV